MVAVLVLFVLLPLLPKGGVKRPELVVPDDVEGVVEVDREDTKSEAFAHIRVIIPRTVRGYFAGLAPRLRRLLFVVDVLPVPPVLVVVVEVELVLEISSCLLLPFDEPLLISRLVVGNREYPVVVCRECR